MGGNSLEGKVAVVLGGGRGIGREICRAYAAQGAHIALIEKSPDTSRGVDEELRGKCQVIHADLSATSMSSVVEELYQRCGRLDVIVSSARYRPASKTSADDLSDWSELSRVELTAPLEFIQAALPRMSAAGGGRVIFLSSTNAFFISQQNLSYHMAKGAVIQAVKYLAYRYARQGIRAFAVCPGLVDIPNEDRVLSKDKDQKAAIQQCAPLGRSIDVKEVAELCGFLASGRGDGLNGQALILDGGVSLGDHFKLSLNSLTAEHL